MKRIAALGLALLLLGGVALAQPPAEGEHATDLDDSDVFREYPDPPPDAPPSRLGVVFDLVGQTRTIAVEPYHPFDIYVVAYDTQIALRGWEARVELDPRIRILSTEMDGLDVGKGGDHYVALKPKFCKDGPVIVLQHHRAVLTEPNLVDLPITLGPTSRSSFEPPSPGYLVCRPGSDLRPFEHCARCAVVNPDQLLPDGIPPEAEGPFTPARGRH